MDAVAHAQVIIEQWHKRLIAGELARRPAQSPSAANRPYRSGRSRGQVKVNNPDAPAATRSMEW